MPQAYWVPGIHEKRSTTTNHDTFIQKQSTNNKRRRTGRSSRTPKLINHANPAFFSFLFFLGRLGWRRRGGWMDVRWITGSIARLQPSLYLLPSAGKLLLHLLCTLVAPFFQYKNDPTLFRSITVYPRVCSVGYALRSTRVASGIYPGNKGYILPILDWC